MDQQRLVILLLKSLVLPVVLCMQYSVIRTRITCLYGAQHYSVVFACKNSDFWTSIQVSMGTRPHQSFCAYKTGWLAQGTLLSMGSSPHQWFCAIKIAPLCPKLHVSMGPSPHVCFLDAKQRLLDWNYKALWVKDHTFCFCKQNFDFWTRITSLYGSQTWPVILCMYNSVLNIRNTSLYGSQPSSVVFTFKTSWLASELLVSMGPRPRDMFLDAKQRRLDRINKSLWVPNITCRFVHAKQCD